MIKLPAITPGPWRVAPTAQITVEDEAEHMVLSAFPDMRVSSLESLERMRANSKAAAAVPAMLEALAKALPVLKADSEAVEAFAAPGEEVSTPTLAYEAVQKALRLAGATDA